MCPGCSMFLHNLMHDISIVSFHNSVLQLLEGQPFFIVLCSPVQDILLKILISFAVLNLKCSFESSYCYSPHPLTRFLCLFLLCKSPCECWSRCFSAVNQNKQIQSDFLYPVEKGRATAPVKGRAVRRIYDLLTSGSIMKKWRWRTWTKLQVSLLLDGIHPSSPARTFPKWHTANQRARWAARAVIQVTYQPACRSVFGMLCPIGFSPYFSIIRISIYLLVLNNSCESLSSWWMFFFHLFDADFIWRVNPVWHHQKQTFIACRSLTR